MIMVTPVVKEGRELYTISDFDFRMKAADGKESGDSMRRIFRGTPESGFWG